jgi:adenosylcobinamide-GDP ribazoletransferase
MRTTAVAFAFLTRLPVPSVAPREGDLTRASALFPLVGLVVATLAVAARALAEPLWGPAAGAVAGVFTAVAVTGAFHEDGLADTADGLWGGWDPEQRLAIMRDSRLGTYGTIALLGLFAARIALLAAVPLEAFAVAMVCGHVLGRAAPLVLVRSAPTVPGRSGVQIAGPLPLPGAVIAAVVTLAVPFVAAGLAAVPALAIAAVVTFAAAWLFRRRLGGVTGDTLGATTVVVEVGVIAAVLAWP